MTTPRASFAFPAYSAGLYFVGPYFVDPYFVDPYLVDLYFVDPSSSSGNVSRRSLGAGGASVSRWERIARCTLAVTLLVLAAALPSLAATDTVTSLVDNSTSLATLGTLRYWLANAASGDTIVFSVTGTITLDCTDPSDGPIVISQNLTISGPGANNLAISGNNACEVFQFNSGVTATISGVTIENGSSQLGAGISNAGELTVSNSNISGNSAHSNSGGFGGGIYNSGTVTAINSTFSGNTADSEGGGIYNDSGTVTLSNSTFFTNSSYYGGGIYNNGGTVTLSNSTFSGNHSTQDDGQGGGIFNGGTLTASNNTFSGNSASEGGGIFNYGTLTLSNSTFSGNSASVFSSPTGAALFNFGYGGSSVTFKGVLMANNTPGSSCGNIGILVSDGYNLEDGSSCNFNQPTDQSGVTTAASFLGPLQNNGGPTQTIALLSGSTAIDAIPLSACTDAFGNPVIGDERGVHRPQGSGCDIGAYELTQVPTANVCPNGQSTPSPCSAPITLQYYVPSGTTLKATNPVRVVTQGTAGLDFNLGSNGDTCTASLAGPAYCRVPVTFAPIAPGVRLGASTLFDSNGNVVASYLISGIGDAPAVAFTPSPQSALSVSVSTPPSTLNSPNSVTVDAAGDVFISDSQNNRIVEVPGGTGTPVVVPATGLSSPGGVAVDGAGDVFIADTQNKQVVEVPASGGPQIVVASGFLTPVAVAVDGAGDLFVVDLGASQVVEIPFNNGPRTTVSTGSYTLSSPQGVAVDAAGNIFIADTGNTRVLEVPAGGASASIVPTTGLVFVSSVAVDAAGDVFIGDAGSNDRIIEVPAGGGSQITVTSSGFTLPAAVAVDGAGNVYIADYLGNQIVKVSRSQTPSLSFATTVVGQTSADSPQQVTVQNIGNENLTGSLALTLGGNFTQNVSPDCASEFPLAAGTTCSESFSFTPQTGGSLTGTAVFTDNTLNYSPDVQQTINLNGIATVAVPSVVGELAATAETAITNAGLTYTTSSASSSTVPIGDVISENPSGGTVVSSGTSVGLVISTGVTVPNVVGDTQTAATMAITTAGLKLGTVTTASSNTVPSGDVISQSPLANEPANGGTSVNLIVSTGPAQYLLTTAASPASGGTVSPATGLQNASAIVPISATAASGYVFSSWIGPVASANSASTTVTMSGPESVTANFLPALGISPSGVSFGTVTLWGGTSQYLTITNNTAATVNFSRISLGSLVNVTYRDLTYDGGCMNPLKPGKNCTITLSLWPSMVGNASAILTLQDTASGPQKVGITATVIAPKANVSPWSLTFALETVGDETTAKTVTLSNPGIGPLTISGVTITGQNAADFLVTGNSCGGSLAAGSNSSCTINVSFKPKAKGSRSATLQITDNAQFHTQTVSLSGTGH